MENLLISKEDECLLEKYKCYYDNSNGYWRLKVGPKVIYLHRFILNAKKGELVDHKNRNKQDNRRENLRIVSKSLNNYNTESKNKYGKGICFEKSGNRFRAMISHKNKTIKLGSFKNIIDAKKAYNKKAIDIYGLDAYQHEI